MNLSLEHDSSDPGESEEVLVNDIITRLLRLGKFLHDNAKVLFFTSIDFFWFLNIDFLIFQVAIEKRFDR